MTTSSQQVFPGYLVVSSRFDLTAGIFIYHPSMVTMYICLLTCIGSCQLSMANFFYIEQNLWSYWLATKDTKHQFHFMSMYILFHWKYKFLSDMLTSWVISSMMPGALACYKIVSKPLFVLFFGCCFQRIWNNSLHFNLFTIKAFWETWLHSLDRKPGVCQKSSENYHVFKQGMTKT